MADNAYTKLSLGGQLGVSFALAVLVGGLFWYLYWSDATVERDEKTAKLEALNKEIRALEVTAQKLGEFQREVALLEKKLETLKSILPRAKETQDLMRKVQALAAQSTRPSTTSPRGDREQEFYQGGPSRWAWWATTTASSSSTRSRGFRAWSTSTTSRSRHGNRRRARPCVANTATTFVYIEAPPGAEAGGGAR